MIINRTWEMPNSNTFDIKCINKLIHKYLRVDYESIDPFANKSTLARITNDLNPIYGHDYQMDAIDFLKMFKDNSIDFVFYDPPYSLRQVSECYKNVGIAVTTQTTQSSWRTCLCSIFSVMLFPVRVGIRNVSIKILTAIIPN